MAKIELVKMLSSPVSATTFLSLAKSSKTNPVQNSNPPITDLIFHSTNFQFFKNTCAKITQVRRWPISSIQIESGIQDHNSLKLKG